MALYRTTSDPNVTCPEDLYSSDELERMDQAADLEMQIDAIDRQLQEIDDHMHGADNAGDFRSLSALESRLEELVDLQIELQLQLNKLNFIDELLPRERRAQARECLGFFIPCLPSGMASISISSKNIFFGRTHKFSPSG